MSTPVDKECKSIDFFTPQRIVSVVRDYFVACGAFGIGLDPATAPENPTGAQSFLTIEDDGLKSSWGPLGATVFVNPPYGLAIRQWVEKIGREAKFGLNIVALLPGQRFEQAYWQENLFIDQLQCLVAIRSRVQFTDVHGNPLPGKDGTGRSGNPYGSFLYCYNGNRNLAFDHFSKLGMCLGIARVEQHRKEAKA